MKRIYGKTVRELFSDYLAEVNPKENSIIQRENIQKWFREKYPKIKPNTINCHIIRLSTNIPSRIHYLKEGNTSDNLFFALPDGNLRIYNNQHDPSPIYKKSEIIDDGRNEIGNSELVEVEGSKEFALEEDLKKWLAINLETIEPGLKLYEEEEITGIEYDVGGRRIDILALDNKNNYVVLELKVSRGYDRVVGQILRYMNWVEENLAEPNQNVRGIIVCREISTDLMLACKNIGNISIYGYELNVKLNKVK
jgi:hypothetical protein